MVSRKFREKVSGTYYEKHHILPRSMGGDNSKENLVNLTAREHFLAHWLLWRMLRNRQTARAFFTMQKWRRSVLTERFSSVAYEEARTEMRLLGVSDETRQRMSKAFMGRKYSPETRNKMVISAKARKRTLKRISVVENCAECGAQFETYFKDCSARYCGISCSRVNKARKMRQAKNTGTCS
jgi:hypothetical protein